MNLGAIERKLDLRDIKLGRVQAPVEIPPVYETDIKQLEALYQGQTPTCGAHSGSHLKAILDLTDTGVHKYSPRFLWLMIKRIDGYPLEVGTDMRSIFKSLQEKGVCDWDLLPNNFPTTIEDYSDQSAVGQKMVDNAAPRVISSYAFCSTDIASIKQAIYQNKAVLLLLNVDKGWWGNNVPTVQGGESSGHFVVAYGYSENMISIIDSADKVVPFKKLVISYPLREAGTAIDLPDSVVIRETQKRLLAKLQLLLSLYQKLLALLKRSGK